jgi:hypothetical protein
MNKTELELIVNTTEDSEKRATAYAALTLTTLLASEWTHVIPQKGKEGGVVHIEVVKAAGQIVGPRADLEARLGKLLAELKNDGDTSLNSKFEVKLNASG